MLLNLYIKLANIIHNVSYNFITTYINKIEITKIHKFLYKILKINTLYAYVTYI